MGLNKINDAQLYKFRNFLILFKIEYIYIFIIEVLKRVLIIYVEIIEILFLK